MCEKTSKMNISEYCNLEDKRLETRLETLLAQMDMQTNTSVNNLAISNHQKKAYYRFINNSKVYSENLMLGYQQFSINEAISSSNVILALQDTTELDFTGNRSAKNLDCLEYKYRKGTYLHNHLLTSDLGVPLGLFSQNFYAYKAENLGKSKERRYTPISEKHSYRWITEFESLQTAFKDATDQTVISISDRESDIHELLEARKYDHVHYIVRSSRDRKLENEVNSMWQTVSNEVVCFTYDVRVPCKKNRNEHRTATIAVRYTKVCIKPSYRKGKTISPIDLWIVDATEISAPLNEKAICWRLLTSIAVDSAAIAEKIIGYYVLRWVIERFHYVLKQGNKVEDLQIQAPEALKNAIILQSWIAIKVCALAYQNKTAPQTTLEEMGYEQQDYQIAYAYVKTKINKKIIKVENPTLYDFSTLIAQIGGSNLQKNRHLGVVSLWKGWNKFLIIRETWLMQKDVGNQ